jgi:hypothetical protein
MFKPALRSAQRALPRSAVRNHAASCRRTISSAVRNPASAEGRRVAAFTAVGVLGGLAAYQLLNASEVHAEAPLSTEDRKANFSSQHLQVASAPPYFLLQVLIYISPGQEQFGKPWSVRLGR